MKPYNIDRLEDICNKYNQSFSKAYDTVLYLRTRLFLKTLKNKGFYYRFTDKFEDKALEILERKYRIEYNKRS